MSDHECTECGSHEWSDWELHERYEYGPPFVSLSQPVAVVNGVSTRCCHACGAREIKVRAPLALHSALASAIVDKSSTLPFRERYFVRSVLKSELYQAEWTAAGQNHYLVVWQGNDDHD